MGNVSIKNASLNYATVRQQRAAIETGLDLLNQVGKMAMTSQIKAGEHVDAIREMLKKKDNELFEREQDLFFIISQLD